MPNQMGVLPQFQGSLYDIQRKQALAQALMQGGLSPAEIPSTPGAKLSPWAGVNKVLQAVAGGYLGNQASQDMGNLGQQQYGALMQMFGGGQPQAQANPQVDPNAPPDTADGISLPNGGNGVPQGQSMQSGSSGGSLRIPGLNPQAAAMAYLLNPDEYTKAALAQYAPTDATKMAMAAGSDPMAANAGALKKALFIEPTAGRPGGYLKDNNTGQMSWMPAVPQGGMPVQDADGNFTGAVTAQPGGAQVEQAITAAKEAGQGSQLPYQGYDAQGNPLPLTNRTQAATGMRPDEHAIVQAESNGNPNAVSAKGALGAWQVMPNTLKNPGFGVTPAQNNSPQELNRVGQDYYNALAQHYGSPTMGAIAYNMGPSATDSWLKNGAQWEKLPAETRNYVGKVSTLTALNANTQSGASAPSPQGQPSATPIYGAQPMGAVKAANNAQDELSTKYTALSQANSQAQTTNSLLQNIKGLAGQAIVGPQSSKLNFVNGLLSLVSQKANDMQTANDLINKYGNQIVARLGQGSLGTDAARSLVAAANPNAHMTQGAINEAVDNLVASNNMLQAKARYLAAPANARQPAQYNQRELVFDQYADPRVWQYINMQNPAQRAQFARQTMQQDPQFANRIKTLEGMGVL